MQPIYTTISDVVGRKAPLYASIFFFAVGSIVFALANSMSIVILGRVLQGLGGGGLDVLQEIILADITSLKERPLYLGLLAIPMAVGTVLGPITGALFSEFASWRWIGWANLPLVATAFLLAVFCLRLKSIDLSFRSKLRRLDWVGMLLFAVGSTGVTLPLSWAGAMYPWSSWRTITPLVIGILMLVAFGFYERRPAEPLFPYRIFNNTTAVVTLAGAFIHGMVMFTLLQYLPLFFQAVLRESPLGSAVLTLQMSLFVVFFSGVSAAAVEYTRKYRWIIWVAWILTGCGVGLWAHGSPTTSRVEIAMIQIVGGIGIGSMFMILAIPIQASVASADDAGLAVGIMVAFRLFGALVGLSVGSTIFSSVFAESIMAIGPLPEALAFLEDGKEAVAFIPSLRNLELPDKTMSGLIDAYRKPFQVIWIAFACISVVGFVSSLFTKELTLENDDLGRQRFEERGEQELTG